MFYLNNQLIKYAPKSRLCSVLELEVEQRFCLNCNAFVVVFYYYKITCEQAVVKNSVSFSAIRVVLASYRTSPHPCLNWRTPAEVLHGRQLKCLLSLFLSRDYCRSTPGSSTPRLDTFDKSKENWAQYIERLDQHFVLHNVTDLDKKRAFLLSSLDPETYKRLQNLFGELNVSEQTFADLVEKLSNYFKRAIHVQASRYSFYNCQMEANQSYAEWVATLRGIAKNCEFSCKSEACKITKVTPMNKYETC